MLVKGIPLPADAESRGGSWPCVGEPSAADLAAIEAEFPAAADAIDWGRFEAERPVEPAAVCGRVPTLAATVRRWQEVPTGALVELATGGLMEAFGLLFERLAPQMVRVTFRRTRDYALAEDIVSEVWARVLTAADRWERRSDDVEDDFRRMVFGLARHAAAAHFANIWRESPADMRNDEDCFDSRMSTPVDDAPADPVKVALIEKLRAGIDGLGSRQREVVKLLSEGFSQAEIGEHLGLTLLQVRSAKRTALTQLQARLSDPFDDATVGQLRAAIALLPDPHRQVMFMRMIEGLGLRHIADETGLDYEQVRSLTTNARITMRQHLASPATSGLADLDAARAKRRRELERLREAASDLPAAQRQVALLRLDGMAFRDIAVELGKTVSGVTSVWRAGLESLARLGVVVPGSVVATGPRADVASGKLGDLDAARAKRVREADGLRAAAQSLPPVQRQVVLLHLDGMRFSEIERATGKSKAAVSSAWRAAQNSLTRRGALAAADMHDPRTAA